MNAPRHLLALGVALAAALPAAGAARAADGKLRVVATLEDLSSIAGAVGGDRVATFALARGYQDPHFVDAKPSLVLQLARADLLIVAGLDLESGYLPPLLDQSRNGRIRPGAAGHLDASAGCEVLGRPTGPVTRAMGDVHPYGNPHYWTDPENGRRIARSVAAKLAQLDPAGAAVYARNLAAFEEKLTAKLAEWQARMRPYAGQEVVTFHDSWPNFAKRFGLVVAGHVEPKPGIPPSPAHTLEIVNLIKARQIPLILVEPYFDAKTPRFIAGKSGATVLVFYPSVGGVPAIADYFDLFDANVSAFVAAMEARP
jgi:ABC-type Zn uptake system ZnuABC Zn-binding protein ZnuA